MLLVDHDQAQIANGAENGAPRSEDDAAVTRLRGQLFFAGEVANAPGVAELEAALASDPDAAESLYQLALRKVVEEDYETAMDLLLRLMQTDRSYGDDAGRLGLLKVFELLGDDPLVGRYRSRMASLLY